MKKNFESQIIDIQHDITKLLDKYDQKKDMTPMEKELFDFLYKVETRIQKAFLEIM